MLWWVKCTFFFLKSLLNKSMWHTISERQQDFLTLCHFVSPVKWESSAVTVAITTEPTGIWVDKQHQVRVTSSTCTFSHTDKKEKDTKNGWGKFWRLTLFLLSELKVHQKLIFGACTGCPGNELSSYFQTLLMFQLHLKKELGRTQGYLCAFSPLK